ncbi:MAG: PIN domain-containing protein [Bacillota bacterium]|nr:PIN domain-containing protein [Bacillota bacterium]
MDTSAFIALYDPSDRHHVAARRFFTAKEIQTRRFLPVTSNFVFAEVYAYFCRRHAAAVAVGEALRSSKVLRWLRPEIADEEAAWELAKKYADKDFSFVDCLSFVLMKKLGCQTAFAFDEHFRQLGFELLPAGASA